MADLIKAPALTTLTVPDSSATDALINRGLTSLNNTKIDTSKVKVPSYEIGFGQKLKNYSQNPAVQQGLQTAMTLIPETEAPNAATQSVYDAHDQARQIAMKSGNPYAMAEAFGDKILEETGGLVQAAGDKYDAANTAASFLMPGAGYFLKSLPTYQKSDALTQMAGAYADTNSLADDAATMSGTKTLFGRKSQKRKIRSAIEQDQAVQDIKDQADEDMLQQMYGTPTIQLQNQMALMGGFSPNLARAAKSGGILTRIERAKTTNKNIIKLGNVTPKIDIVDDSEFFDNIEDPVFEFKNGGTIDTSNDDAFFNALQAPKVEEFKSGGELNIIPEGALHARKHNIEGTENLTQKGIPVVAESEGGELEQQAEIEVNEIIFRLDVTKKLEELYNKFKQEDTSKAEKAELAIEAGKILTCEIMEKTDDKTGLIEQVQ